VSRKRSHPLLPDTALARVAARFSALGDPSRLKIVNHLMNGERSVGELIQQTGLSQTNLSRHLGVLRQTGLVERRAAGNRALYRICDPSLAEVCGIVCASLADQLAGDLEGLQAAGL
jgi:ArsR family transcriptional regulator